MTRIATVLRRVVVVAETFKHSRAAWVVLNPRTGKTLVRTAAALRPLTREAAEG